MGFAAAGDVFCLCCDMALQGLQNCVTGVDYTLLYDEDLQTHFQRI